MLLALLLLACAPRLASGDPPVPGTAAPIPEAVAPIPEAAPPVPRDPGPHVAPAPVVPPATLVAEPCGERAFVREIDLQPGTRFTARDLVSPCPPGVRCVWSGIVTRTGVAIWREGYLGLEVASAVPPGPSGPPGAPFPARLAPAGQGILQDDDGCPYRVKTP